MATCTKCGRSLSRYSPGPECGACAWNTRSHLNEPPPIDGTFWEEPRIRSAARDRDLQTLFRGYLDATGLTQEAIALLINRDQGTISKIINGQRKRCTIEDLETIRDGLRIPGHLLGLLPGAHETPSRRTQPQAAMMASPAGARVTTNRAHGRNTSEEEDQDMERRQMLAALGALGITSASPAAEAMHTIGAYVEKNLGRDPSTQMDEWEQTVSDHGYAYLSLPPAQLLPELAADIVTVHSIRPRIKAGHPQYTRWCRVTSGLACLMAKTLCNLGHLQETRAWWATAQHAADAAGDIDLSLWVSGERMTHGLYAQRPARVLLRQASDATAATKHPCGGLVYAHTVQAQVLALHAGQEHEALQELRRAEAVFAKLPTQVTADVDTVWSWGEDRLRYVEAWVHAHLGNVTELDDATHRALELLKDLDPRTATQVKLLRASGRVRAGDVTEGVKLASATYAAWPAEHRTTMLRRLADEVRDAVPAGQRHLPAVTAYRELVASSSCRREVT